MATYNLYHLPDDVLFLSNDNFYNFVAQVCGKVEAELLQIQRIRNARSLIRSTNLFSILEIDCDEIDKLKQNLCFTSKDGNHIIRQGVKLNLDNLYDVLKEKQEKFLKKRRQQELLCSISTLQTTNTGVNDNNNNNLTTQNLVVNVTTDSNLSSLQCRSINDHAIFIKDLIEKFSFKTFTSTILKNDEHYQLIITQDGQKFKAIIKCQCGAKLILPSRSGTSTFILSNFYAHSITSNCSMAERIRKQEKKTTDKETAAQPLSISDSQLPTPSSSHNSSVITNSSKRIHNDIRSEINKNSSKKQKR
ncbi:unnamed protein product [Rotaria sp. Silwood2]|nr:unnamed protein product [Rotaria sp. Silwood2]CAF3328941.1 unnamed protein product [Rotaria sp. Silwood2]CAF4373700.1 unnamed protein product [Rotaria sp. Silwood2]CAF4463144.1 unnamed protein product [Rotaria sp. Silwood2]